MVDKSPATLRLNIRNLTKTFGPNRALSDVSLSVRPGEVHGLVGQNGSGKSTLVKVISGYHAPDQGSKIRVDDRLIRTPIRSADLRDLGIAVVHQDLGLVDRASVVENLRIGLFETAQLTRRIHWRRERVLASEILSRLGLEIDPRIQVGHLSAAERATVAIARALQRLVPGRGLLLLDEATRALPPDSVDHFYRLLRSVTEIGTGVLLVSHSIEEVLARADRVTILRDGKIVGDGLPIATTSLEEIIDLLLGYQLRHTSRVAFIRDLESTESTRDLIQVEAVSGKLVRDVSFKLHSGEVLGVTGLIGSGFEEIPYLLSGAQRARSGVLSVGSTRLQLDRNTLRDFLAAGVVIVPERRDRDGLVMSMNLLENVTIPRVQRHRGVYLEEDWQLEEVEWVIREFGVRPANPLARVGNLSGGNQQKVLLGKWLRGNPKLVILHEPTQGVDIGARQDLWTAIGAAASQGVAVIVAASDAKELASLCDRVLVLREGQIAVEMDHDINFECIIGCVYGQVDSMSTWSS